MNLSFLYRRVSIFLVTATLGSLSATVSAQMSFKVDFQGDTVGANPTTHAPYVFEQNGSPQQTFVDIVSDATSPANPFPGLGNKSLMLTDLGVGAPDSPAIVQYRVPFANTHSIASFKFMLTNPTGAVNPGNSSTWPYLDIRLGTENFTSANGLDAIGPWIDVINYTSATTFRLGTWAPSRQAFDNVLNINQPYTLAIRFNTITDTYTATIDGVPLTRNSGTDPTHQFLSNLTSLNSINFQVAFSTRGESRAFFDDIVMLPEPSSALMLIPSALLLMRRRVA